MLVTRVPRHRPDEAGEIGWLQGQLAPAVREDVITYPMCDMAMPELTPAFRHDAQLGAVVICTDCTAPSVVEFVNEVISLRPATTSELIAMKRDPAFAAALAQVSAARER